MLGLTTIVGMTSEERQRHLGPQYAKGRGSAPRPKAKPLSEGCAWIALILLVNFGSVLVLAIIALRGVR